MQKIGDSTSTANAEGEYMQGNPAAGVDATLIRAEWLNTVQRELIAVVLAGGLALDPDKDDQVLTAIRSLNKQPVFLTDIGTAGSYKAVNSPALTALPNTGFIQYVSIANANAGASTYAPDGLAAKPIYGLGLQALQGGELAVGPAVLMYLVQVGVNGGNGAWVILESLGGASQVGQATKSQHAVALGQLASPIGTTQQQFDNSKAFATTEFVKNAGLQYSKTTVYASGPQVLTAAMAGTLIDCASSYTGNMTLPAASSLPDGACFTIWSGAAANFNLLCAGSDVLFVNQNAPVTSITIRPGGTLTIEKSPASNTWIATSGSEQFPFSTTYAGLSPKPINVPGVGAWQSNIGTVNTNYFLPAGGTWAYFAMAFTSAGVQQTSVPPFTGVAAGGSLIAAAVASQYWYGFCWRLQ